MDWSVPVWLPVFFSFVGRDVQHSRKLTVENWTGASIMNVLCSKLESGVFWDGGDSERNDLVDNARWSRAAAPDLFRINPFTFCKRYAIRKLSFRKLVEASRALGYGQGSSTHARVQIHPFFNWIMDRSQPETLRRSWFLLRPEFNSGKESYRCNYSVFMGHDYKTERLILLATSTFNFLLLGPAHTP